MATQVRETSAGKSVYAFIVLNKKGEHVATVNAHYSNGGRVSVDVWNVGSAAAAKCYNAAMATLKPEARAAAVAKAEREALAKHDWRKADDVTNWAAFDLFGLQQSHAGGYGYDKFAAALRGLWIDGHQMADHCGTSPATEKLLKAYLAADDDDRANPGAFEHAGGNPEWRKVWDSKAAKLGAHFANGRKSLYLETGLKRLETLGYRVIQAI